MPHYRFALKDGSRPSEDDNGVQLSGREEALAYAREVAYELMRGQEARTRPWQLEVYENDDESPVLQIPFASIDRTLDHLLPETRQLIVDVGERRRSLMEAVHDVRATVIEARALVRLSKGRPYLAAHLGRRTIRER